MTRWKRIVATLMLLAAAIGPVIVRPAAAQEALDPAMAALWERTDRPVAEHTVDRSWLWGPQANHILREPYTYAPLADSRRLVAYFDKSRMEINNPNGDPSDPWYITNGRLVYEMMTGRIQVGQDPDRYDAGLPALIPVAGDPYSYTTPTYQAMGRLMAGAPDRVNQTITATVDAFGSVGENPAPLETRTARAYITYPGPDDTQVGHNIPDVFMDFLEQQISPLVAPANWIFVTGYPLTEAYWTRTMVGGAETDVLLQCFERRCLTYTPQNEDPFKVEMGNVGQHSYMWRYEGWRINCSATPVRGFGALWSGNDSVRSRLGCAETYLGGEQGIETSYQRFEHGMMIWLNVQDVYNPLRSVLVLYDDGTFARYEDTWSEGTPVEDPAITPPAGRYEPTDGFGKIWREVPGVRDRLGWAIEPEAASAGAYQRFNFGSMVWIEDFDRIWVFYGDLYWNTTGTWESYEDTFAG